MIKIKIPKTPKYGYHMIYKEHIPLKVLDGHYSGYVQVFEPTEQEMQNRIDFIIKKLNK